MKKKILTFEIIGLLLISMIPIFTLQTNAADTSEPKYFNLNPESETDSSFYTISSTVNSFTKGWVSSMTDGQDVTKDGVTFFSNTEPSEYLTASFFIEGQGAEGTTKWIPSSTNRMTVAMYVTYLVSGWDNIDPLNLPKFEIVDGETLQVLAEEDVSSVANQWFTTMIYATVEASKSFRALWSFDWTNMPPLTPTIYIDSWRVVTFDSEETLSQAPSDQYRMDRFGPGTVGFYGGTSGTLSGNAVSVGIYSIMGTGVPGLSLWYEGTKTLVTRIPMNTSKEQDGYGMTQQPGPGESVWGTYSISAYDGTQASGWRLVLVTKDIVYTAGYMLQIGPFRWWDPTYDPWHEAWTYGFIEHVDKNLVVASWISKYSTSNWGVNPDCGTLIFDSGQVPMSEITTPSMGEYRKEIDISRFGVDGSRFYLWGWGFTGCSGWIPTAWDSTYKLSVSPDNQIAQPDSTVEYKVSIASKNGFSSTVSLAVSISPSLGYVGWDLMPAQITPPPNGQAEATLEVNVPVDTPLDAYTITITAQSGSISKPVSCGLSVERSLEVPYQNQGYADWCAFTSLAMVLRYYGKDFHSWKYAEDKNLSTYPPGWETWLSTIEGYTSEHYPELTCKRQYALEKGLLLVDIESNITAGYPVILALGKLLPPPPLFGEGHMIVVVGFNGSGLFINDPSGRLFEWLGISRASYNHAYIDWNKIVDYIVTYPDDSMLAIEGNPNTANTFGTMYVTAHDDIVFYQLDGGLQKEHYELSLNQGLRWNKTSPDNGESELDNIIDEKCGVLYVHVVASNCRQSDQKFTVLSRILCPNDVVHPLGVKEVSIPAFSTSTTSTELTWVINDLKSLLSAGGPYYLEVELSDSNGWQVDSLMSESFYWGETYSVVRGLDDRIYYGDWMVLPGSTIDSPAAAMLGGELHIVVRGSDGNSLWYGYLTDPADPESFSNWNLLSGATNSAPTLTSNGTALCLVVRGLDNRVYYCCYSEGVWGQWYAVPTGATPDAPAAAMLGNDLHIVVRGMDGNRLWDTIVSCDGAVIRGWSLLSGAAPSKPVLACSGSDSLCLVVRGMDNTIYYRSYTGSTDSWADWSAFPTGATIDGPAATVVGNMLCVVVRGSDGNTLWYADVDLGTSSFSGWTLLDGATPSAPTLTS